MKLDNIRYRIYTIVNINKKGKKMKANTQKIKEVMTKGGFAEDTIIYAVKEIATFSGDNLIKSIAYWTNKSDSYVSKHLVIK